MERLWNWLEAIPIEITLKLISFVFISAAMNSEFSVWNKSDYGV
jgi:hypothetical protein